MERSLFDKPIGRGDSDGRIKFDENCSRPAYNKQDTRLRSGTLLLTILLELNKGMETSDKLEYRLNKSHQSVSSALNRLMKKTLIKKSGLTRDTRSGSKANLWELTEVGKAEATSWDNLNF